MKSYYLNSALFALITFSAIACGTQAFKDRNPEISDINVSVDDTHVQIPMPPPQPARVLYRAEAASLWNLNSSGFFADQRASTIGDLLTVNIEINDKASLSNESDTSRSGSSSIGDPVLFGLENKLDEIIPGVSAEELPAGDKARLSSTTSTNGNGSIERDETIELKIAALVTQKLPNGSLVIAGRQEVKVNSELRELRIAGIIRPQDIEQDNSIPYEKIAEARISYGGRGQLSRTQRTNYGGTIADVILPY